MAVSTRDVSNYDGVPVMLYEFSRRSVPTLTGVEVTSFWRYTSADRDFTLGANTYAAMAISDDGVRQSGDSSSDQLTITMPYNADIPLMFVGSPPSDPIYAVIRHANEGETDSFLVWAGVVGVVARTSDTGGSGDTVASVVCNTITASMDRTGLRLSWSRNCPHDLYGFECKVDPTLHYTSGAVTALSGNLVTVEEFAGIAAPATLVGGFLEWIDAMGHAERLGIMDHGGDTIRVLGTADRLTIGTVVYGFLGCDRHRATCNDTFDNLPNHGGHAYMPDKNPFSGDLIF